MWPNDVVVQTLTFLSFFLFPFLPFSPYQVAAAADSSWKSMRHMDVVVGRGGKKRKSATKVKEEEIVDADGVKVNTTDKEVPNPGT
jgi:hypothetical protein